MPLRTPPSLNALCRDTLPLLLRQADGRQMLKQVADLVESERWNSFDQFHRTTDKLVQYYARAGAIAEVDAIQTGGQIGSGRWIIQEAADVRAATVDIVAPFKERLLDYKENPWHIIQWSAAAPKEGLRAALVVLDERADIERLGVGSLRGKVVLTRQDPRSLLGLLADRGAVGVLSDRPVPNNPQALAWTKFGWGAIPMEHATARLVGYVLSQRQGEKLRRQLQKHSQLSLLLKADIRKYVGSHDVVSGIVRGSGDPQDEVWAIAHSGEPGAADNASGVVQTLEIARLLEGLIASGKLKRPRRSIRLLNAYECYGFFAYLERKRRLQTPLAGVCIDTVGIRPDVCGGRLEWHATIPMSAAFVDRIGAAVLRAALRRHQPGYKLFTEPFVSTSDTLIGDPHYGFPCPWITTHHKRAGSGFDAYHSSADQIGLLSSKGMETCAASMAAYLYYLADMGSREVAEVGRMEGAHFAGLAQEEISPQEADYLREAHALGNRRLERWLWGGDRRAVLAGLAQAEGEVAAQIKTPPQKKLRAKVSEGKAARLIPRRTAFLSPTAENAPIEIGRRIQRAGLPSWALFWADGQRTIGEIAARIECEETASVGGGRVSGRRVDVEKLVDFFAAHADLGYVELVDPGDMLSKKQLVADLRGLGIKKGMDLMVHSSLSALGPVRGGAPTVVEALLEVVGRSGTLLMPSFNHRAAAVYNALTTPTTNGAIPDAFWRRADAYRSQHPTHAVAASGARAAWYCSEHLDVGIWAAESPIGKLVHHGGYILALGTTHSTSTAYHVAEMSVPCGCIESFANEDRVVGIDGQVQAVRGLAFRGGECPVPIGKLEAALDRRRLQQRGSVGAAAAQLVLANDLWKVRREQLRSACPQCAIKPQIR
jgi:aminoglycoside 3-N-acetyltransferase